MAAALQLSPVTDDPEEARRWSRDYRAAGVEGLVVKGAAGRYLAGQRQWLKVMSWESTEVIAGGVIGPIERPSQLVVGRYRDGQLVIVGRASPLSRQQTADLADALTPAGPDHPWPDRIVTVESCAFLASLPGLACVAFLKVVYGAESTRLLGAQMGENAMTATNETSAGRRTTAKVIGSLGVIAAAAAVAGIGTFGTFTDSTAMAVDLDAGIVSIDLSVPGGPRMIPVMMNNFVPGDSLTRGVNLTNDGDAALSTVRLLSTVQASSSVLADPANGLQLSLTACSRAWSRGGTNELPTYTCGGTQSTLYSGPATADEVLVDPDSLAPGGTDKLVFTISLPGTAGNDVQGSSATVSLAFTAVQRAGDSR